MNATKKLISQLFITTICTTLSTPADYSKAYTDLCIQTENNQCITRAPRPKPELDITGASSPLPGIAQSIATAVNQAIQILKNDGIVSAINLGAGTGVFANKNGSTLRFKSLKEGANMLITTDDNTITLTSTGSGGVTGPDSSTDNAISRFNGTTGQIIQNSNATIDDSGNTTIAGTLDVTGGTTLSSTLSLPTGTPSAPSLNFSSSTNTGMSLILTGILTGETKVNTLYPSHYNSSPSIATNSDGSFIITWVCTDNFNVYAQRFNAAGEKVGSEIQVNTLRECHSSPNIATNSDGSFIITWVCGTDPNNVYMQRFNADGEKVGSEIQVNTLREGLISSNIATNSDGSFIITWVYGKNPYNVYMQRFNADGEKVGTEEIQVNTQYPSDPYSTPHIATNSDSSFIITWVGGASPYNVYMQRFDADGEKVGTEEIQVNTQYPSENVSSPSIATNSDGSFIITWTCGADPWNVYMQRFNADGEKIGSETKVNTQYPSFFYLSPSIATNSDGSFIITWTCGEDPYNVYVQRFDADGEKVSSETKVNTQYPSYALSSPSIVTNWDGSFIITWTCGNEPYNVYMQRFYAGRTQVITSVNGAEILNTNDNGISITGSLTASGTTTLNNLVYTWPDSATAGAYLEADAIDDNNVTLTWSTPSSDARVKQHINTIDQQDSLERISKLNPVEFEFIPELKKTLRIHGHASKHAGFIAQETQGILPTVVVPTNTKVADGTPLYTIEYHEITPYLVGALQALIKQGQEMQQKIVALEHTIKKLQEPQE